MKENQLWTRNFTIITLGSIISMLGNSIAGFAMGLLVLDYTKSTFLYGVYLLLFTLPRIVAPIIAGPIMDRFSRKKTIYILDFFSALIYCIYAFIMFTGNFNFGILAVGCLVLGTIESVYEVAYTSFYPLLIPQGQFQKAYSVSSVLETLTAFMVPVSMYLYNKVGIVPLMIANAISFFIAAVAETMISIKEEYKEARIGERFTLNRYTEDFKFGMDYLKSEKGLFAIAVFFSIMFFSNDAVQVLTLPYFKGNFPNGESMYINVWAGMIIGRTLGGSYYYKMNRGIKDKYKIAVIVYALSSLLHGIYLFFPYKTMFVFCLVMGVCGVTSYNIRISSTQTYVPDDIKGRYNGTFQMMCTTGSVIGQMAASGLSLFLPERPLISVFMMINLAAVFLVVIKNKEAISKIYNMKQ